MNSLSQNLRSRSNGSGTDPRLRSNLRKIIDNILGLKLPTYFRVQLPTKNILVPSDQYFYYIYQALMYMGEKHTPRRYPYLIEIVHHMTDTDKRCFNTIWFNSEKNGIYIGDAIVSARSGVHDLVRSFLRKNGPNICKTVSVNLIVVNGKEVHQNVLLVEYSVDRVRTYLYEPHGTFVRKDIESAYIYDFIRDFTSKLGTSLGVKGETIKPKKISCRLGIQTRLQKDMGFCTAIGLFWLYTVLVLSKTFPLKEVVENTERLVIKICDEIDMENSDKSLDILIVKFSALLSMNTIEIMQKIPRYQEFEGKVVSLIDEEKKNFPVKVMTSTDPRYKRLGRKASGETHISTRTRIGSPCSRNRDCVSDKCLNGKCVEYDYTKSIDPDYMESEPSSPRDLEIHSESEPDIDIDFEIAFQEELNDPLGEEKTGEK